MDPAGDFGKQLQHRLTALAECAAVEVEAGGVTQTRIVSPTRSYLSQVELPVTFGLGELTTIERLTIHWPDGSINDVPDIGVDKLIVIQQTR